MKKLLYLGNYRLGANNTPSYMEVLGPLLEQEGFKITYGSSVRNKALRMLHMLWLCFTNRNVSFALIDVYSTLNFYYALCCSQLCRILGIKYICLLHGGNLPSRLESNPLLSKLLFKNSYANLAPSQYMTSAFEDHGYYAAYIPNAFEIENYALQSKEFGHPKLLWVRSFSRIYNPVLAIEVLDILKQTYNNAELCMVGPDKDGSLKEVMSEAKQRGLDVNFTGRLSKEEWISLAKDYNVFINTTNFDNMPLSVLEAMALGFPVISTNVGGLPYLIEHQNNGVLVNKGDADEMSKVIIDLFDDAVLRNKLIINARHKAEKFEWSKIKPQWLSILNG